MRWMGKSVGRAVLIIVMSLPRLLLAAPPAFGQVTIPRVSTPPRLYAFRQLKPTPAWHGKMANLDRFIQRTPSDADPGPPPPRTSLGYEPNNH